MMLNYGALIYVLRLMFGSLFYFCRGRIAYGCKTCGRRLCVKNSLETWWNFRWEFGFRSIHIDLQNFCMIRQQAQA